MNDKALLGSRIRRAREKLRYSQKDAAARLGIHNSTLGKYELGEREPDIETIKKIAEFYQVSPQWIIFGTEEASEPGSDREKLKLIDEEAERLGLSPNDPAFREILFNAIDLIRVARGKKPE